MKIDEFLQTIYLGDRGCKAIFIDGWRAEVKIQVTCISRVRSENWNFYGKEDLIDGFLVFEGVEGIEFSPSGLLPNDLINDIKAEQCVSHPELTCVVLSVDSVSDLGDHTEIFVKIIAASMSLEENEKPGVRIKD